jgi:hypothetical protein
MKAHVGTTSQRHAAVVVDLAHVRDGRRLRELRGRLRASLDRNKRALARLFHSGLLYTRTGARLGRELLLAHQHLLRAGDLLSRVDETGGRRDAETELAARQVLAVLDRTGELYARSDGLLAREP